MKTLWVGEEFHLHIYFDNVEVPIENLLVELEDGFKKLMETFDLERCAKRMALAQASSALDYVQNYVQERAIWKTNCLFSVAQIKLADILMS